MKECPGEEAQTGGVGFGISPKHAAGFLQDPVEPFETDPLDPNGGAFHQASHDVETAPNALDDGSAQLDTMLIREPLFHGRTHPKEQNVGPSLADLTGQVGGLGCVEVPVSETGDLDVGVNGPDLIDAGADDLLLGTEEVNAVATGVREREEFPHQPDAVDPFRDPDAQHPGHRQERLSVRKNIIRTAQDGAHRRVVMDLGDLVGIDKLDDPRAELLVDDVCDLGEEFVAAQEIDGTAEQGSTTCGWQLRTGDS